MSVELWWKDTSNCLDWQHFTIPLNFLCLDLYFCTVLNYRFSTRHRRHYITTHHAVVLL